MKREPRAFVVEVKRGKRRPPLRAEAEGFDPGPSQASRRAEAALFAASGSRNATPGPQSPDLIRRILPSLIERPALAPAQDTAPKRRGRKPGSKNRPKYVAEQLSRALAPIDGSGRAEMDRPGASDAGVETPTAETSVPIHLDTTLPSPPRVRLRNRSAILARYVFRSEPDPGQRWRRPSRRKSSKARKYTISI